MLGIFPSSLAFHCEHRQDQLSNLQEPVNNENVGHKTKEWDPLFKKY